MNDRQSKTNKVVISTELVAFFEGSDSLSGRIVNYGVRNSSSKRRSPLAIGYGDRNDGSPIRPQTGQTSNKRKMNRLVDSYACTVCWITCTILTSIIIYLLSGTIL